MSTVARLVMRVYLPEGYTIRWRRGDAAAYVFADREAGDGDRIAGVIDTIPVSKTGWTDAAEVRTVANALDGYPEGDRQMELAKSDRGWMSGIAGDDVVTIGDSRLKARLRPTPLVTSIMPLKSPRGW